MMLFRGRASHEGKTASASPRGESNIGVLKDRKGISMAGATVT